MTDQSTGNGGGSERKGADSYEIKVGLAEMLKGGVIMDVTTPEQAKIAEEARAREVPAASCSRTRRASAATPRRIAVSSARAMVRRSPREDRPS